MECYCTLSQGGFADTEDLSSISQDIGEMASQLKVAAAIIYSR